jgi:hypothetical protein
MDMLYFKANELKMLNTISKIVFPQYKKWKIWSAVPPWGVTT